LKEVGSYDKTHEAVSLRHMDGKIASVMSVAELLSRMRGGDLRAR